MPIEPVRKHVIVDATPERAFRIFTDNPKWWPREHHIGKADLADVLLEPRKGGRWYERGVDGSECDWGRVLVWDPPKRIVLAWQLTAQWQYDPNFMTEVEVRFAPAGSGKTRVELEHRDLERYGEMAETLRNAVDSPDGWQLHLNHFADAVTSASVEA
jgi:uncharacterized protein YndB with AHSA1/START domain